MKKVFFLLPLPFLLAACVKDKPQLTAAQELNMTASQKVYVLNEGNLGSGKATLSMFDTGNEQVIEDVYRLQNGEGMGDVMQSVNRINRNHYLVINHSSKIIVCDANFKKTAVIGGLPSPRYIAAVSPGKAYVTDLSANAINVVDLFENRVSGKIILSGWTEQILPLYNEAFVCNLRRNYLYVINTVEDKLKDSILVGPNAGNIVIDKFSKVWVLSGGDAAAKVPPSLNKIDPFQHRLEQKIILGGDGASNLCINGAGDRLYFLNGDVMSMRADNETAPTFFSGKGSRNYYGMGVNPANGDVYLADVLDYMQRSNIYVLGADGSQKNLFKAGLISNGFYFE
jgi:DNA-binding beta-propeller fold protein YncE